MSATAVLGMMGAVSRAPGQVAASAVPAATRTRRPGWRDPRMWAGVALVAVSVVLGSRLLAAADDRVPVWAVSEDLGAGDVLTAADLVAHEVGFADEADLEGYFTADEEIPADLRLLRAVGAGELLPRSAVGPAADAGTVQVPVAVDQVPPAVGPGSTVDVYLVAGAGVDPATLAAGPALDDVAVVEVPAPDEAYGVSGRRQLVLAVEESDVAAFFDRLGRSGDAVVTVTLGR
ncbi:hypothetical protein GHK92_07595 [Nocardioides sp. dk4132]|uniref:hypothetical protein n=1 Tax=unclassified Nocardioides TaxID=2615069 RepID=UPI00129580A3|nr:MULTISPECIES: hypothetical protein [unclassified Nocardioides]MQW75732.1 hypothetical protein [Nocardioides sp. dk4132]QGA08618.1 hypothetical protein GFH29_15345 [Nocardioides sp. dk884]